MLNSVTLRVKSLSLVLGIVFAVSALLAAALVAAVLTAVFGFANLARAAIDVDQLTITSPTTSNPVYSKADGGSEIRIDGFGFSSATSTADKIVSAESSTFVLRSGNIYAWGANEDGQLGISDTRDANKPMKVQASGGVEDGAWRNVNSDGVTTCGLNGHVNIKLYCWGNAVGNAFPTPVNAFNNAYPIASTAEVVITSSDVCANVSSGGENFIACMSLQDIDDDSYLFEKHSELTVVKFGKISAAGNTICAVTTIVAEDKLYCNDGSDDVLAPEALPAEISTGQVKNVALGINHSCAVVYAAATQDRIYCWGSANSGQFGWSESYQSAATLADSTQVDFSKLEQDTDNKSYQSPLDGRTVSDIQVGGSNTCAVVNVGMYSSGSYGSPANRPLCWGENLYSQLGDSYASAEEYAPNEGIQRPYAPYPQLSSPSVVKFVSVGSKTTCFVNNSDNKVLCAGDDTRGELGSGNTEDYGKTVGCATISDDLCVEFSVSNASETKPGSNIHVEISPNITTAPTVIITGPDDNHACAVTSFSNNFIKCSTPSFANSTGLHDVSVNETVVTSGVSYIDETPSFTYPTAVTTLEATFAKSFSMQAVFEAGSSNLYIADGALPTGMFLSGSGEIAGVSESTVGDYTFKICAFSALGSVYCSDEITLTLLPGPSITTTETDYDLSLLQFTNLQFGGTGYEHLRWTILNGGVGADVDDLMQNANDDLAFQMSSYYSNRKYWLMDFVSACPSQGAVLVQNEPVGDATDNTMAIAVESDTDDCSVAFRASQAPPVVPILTPPDFWQEHSITFGLPEGVMLSTRTGQIQGTPSLASAGNTYYAILQLIAGTCLNDVCTDNATPDSGWPTLSVTFNVSSGPEITTAELLPGIVNEAYSMRVDATNPFKRLQQLSIAGDPLPSGLVFNGTKIEGTPLVSGAFPISLMVGSENELGVFTWGEPKEFMLNIAGSNIALLDNLPEIEPGQEYLASVQADSTTYPLPTHYTIKDSTNPIVDGLQEIEDDLGLFLNTQTGEITGQIGATTRNLITFTVEASNEYGLAEKTLNIAVNHILRFTTPELPEATNGLGYSVQFSVEGDTSVYQTITSVSSDWVIDCDGSVKVCTATYVDLATSEPKEVDYALTSTLTLPLRAKFNDDDSTVVIKNYSINVKPTVSIISKEHYTIASRNKGDISVFLDVKALGSAKAKITPDVTNCSTGIFPDWLLVEDPDAQTLTNLNFYATQQTYVGEYCFRLTVSDALETDTDSAIIKLSVVDRPNVVNKSIEVVLGESFHQNSFDAYQIIGAHLQFDSTIEAIGSTNEKCLVDLSSLSEVEISGTKNEIIDVSFTDPEITCQDLSTLDDLRELILTGVAIDDVTNLYNDFTLRIILVPPIDEADFVANYNGSDTYEFDMGVDLDKTSPGVEWEPHISIDSESLLVDYPNITAFYNTYSDQECEWPEFLFLYNDVGNSAHLSGNTTVPVNNGCFKLQIRVGSQEVVKKFYYNVSGKPVLNLKEQSIPTSLYSDSVLVYHATGEPVFWSFMDGVTPNIGALACPANISPSFSVFMDQALCYKYTVHVDDDLGTRDIDYFNYGPIVFLNAEEDSGSACRRESQCKKVSLHLSPLIEGDFAINMKVTRTGDTQYFTEAVAMFAVREAAEIDRSCLWASPALQVGEDCDYLTINDRSLPDSNNYEYFQQPLNITGTGVVTYISGCKDSEGDDIPGSYLDSSDPDFAYDHPEFSPDSYKSTCLGLYVDGETLQGNLDTSAFEPGRFAIQITAKNAYTGSSGVSRWFTLPVRSAPSFNNIGVVSSEVEHFIYSPVQVKGTLPISLQTSTSYVSYPYGVLICGTDANTGGSVLNPDAVDYYMAKHVFAGESYIFCNGSPSTVANMYQLDPESGGESPYYSFANGEKYLKTPAANEIYVRCGGTNEPECQKFAFFGRPNYAGDYDISLTLQNDLGSATSTPPYHFYIGEPPYFTTGETYVRANLNQSYTWEVGVAGGGGVISAEVVATNAAEVAAAAAISGVNYSCTVKFSLPTGLSIGSVTSTSGLISGTPTGQDGYYCFKVNVVTTSGVVSQIGQILLLKESQMQLDTLPNARVGVVYAGVAPSGDKTMYYPCYEGDTNQCQMVNMNIDATISQPWYISNEVGLGGQIPPGLYFDSSNNLMGTPSLAGSYTINVLATSTLGTIRKVLNITVEEKPSIIAGSYFPNASEGQAYASDDIPYSISPVSYADTVSFTVATPDAGCQPVESLAGVSVANLCYSGLPPGLSITDKDSDSFKVTGTATAQGIFKFKTTPSSSFKPERCQNAGFAIQYMTTCAILGGNGAFEGLLRVDGDAEIHPSVTLADGVTGTQYREEIPSFSTTTVLYEYLTGQESECQTLDPSANHFQSAIPGLDLSSSGVISGVPTRLGQYHLCVRVSNTHAPGAYSYADVSVLVHGAPEFAASTANHLPNAVVSETFTNSVDITSSLQIEAENVYITGVSNIGAIFSQMEQNIALSLEINRQVSDIPEINARSCQTPMATKVSNVSANGSDFGYNIEFQTVPTRRTESGKYTCFTVIVENTIGFSARVFFFETKARPFFETATLLAPWSQDVDGYSDFVLAKEKRFHSGNDINGDSAWGTDINNQPLDPPQDNGNPAPDPITYTSLDLQTALGASVSLNPSTGEISGRPSPGTLGLATFTITATNSSGLSSSRQFSVDVSDAPILDLPPHTWKIPSGKYHMSYSYQFNVLEDATPGDVSMAINTASIPAGLEFDTDTFTLSGTPDVVMNNPCATLSVEVSKNGSSRLQDVTLCIDDSPPILLDDQGVKLRQQQSLPDAALGMEYSYTLQAEGNTNGEDGLPNGLRFELVSGNLPTGLRIESVEGEIRQVKITGVPSVIGSFYFEVAVYNSLCNPTKAAEASIAGGSALLAYNKMCIDSRRNLLITVGGLPTPSSTTYPTAYLGQGNNGLAIYNDSPEFFGVQPMKFKLGYLVGNVFTESLRPATFTDLCASAESWQGSLLNLVVPTDEGRAAGLVLPPCFALNTNDGRLVGSSIQDLIQNKPAGTLDALDWLEGSSMGTNEYVFALQISNLSGVFTKEYTLEVAGEPKIVSEELDYAIYGLPFSDYITSYGLNPLKYQVLVGNLGQYNMNYDCETGEIFSNSVQFGVGHSEKVEFTVVARNDAGCNADLPEYIRSLGLSTAALSVAQVDGQVTSQVNIQGAPPVMPLDVLISPFSGFDVKNVHINIYELPKADYIMPNAMQGVHYAKAFNITGTKPIDFFPNTSDECLAQGASCVDLRTVSSSIPNGMYFTRDGIIQGVPEKPGIYQFVLASKNIAGYGEQIGQITVLPNPIYSTSNSDSDLFNTHPREGEDTDYELYKFDAAHDAMFDSLLGRYGHDLSKYAKWKSMGDSLGASRKVPPQFILLPMAVSLFLVVVLLIVLFGCVYMFNHKYGTIIKKLPEGGSDRII